MRKIRKRRLQLLGLLLVGVAATTAIALTALQQNINLFYSPAQIVAGEVQPGQPLRAGGMVVPGSIVRDPDSLAVRFDVTDYEGRVTIQYTGILPDLFEEGQGIVAVGRLQEPGLVVADEVLAKHDEEYMPPEVARALEAAEKALETLQTD